MILVDSSVWIDYLEERHTRQTNFLYEQSGVQGFIIGDIIIAEVLQGYKNEKEYQSAKRAVLSVPVYELGGEAAVIKSANNYRMLRKKGVTIRGTIDVLIATFCIEHDCALLYADRDFDVMVQYLGLKSALGKAN